MSEAALGERHAAPPVRGDRRRRVLRVDWRGLSVLAVFVVLWEIWQRVSGQSDVLTASFVDVARSAVALTRDGALPLHYGASLLRVLVGFAVGASLGLACGALLGMSEWADGLLGPSFTTLRQIPIFGLIPLIGLWFGTGELAKLVLIATAAFYPVLLQTQEGLRGTPRNYRDISTVLVFDRWQLLRRVLLPCAMPSVFTGIKHGLAYAWIACVGAELFLGADAGMGSLLAAGRSELRMDYVLLAIVVIAATGYLMVHGVAAIERRVLIWRPSFDRR